MSIYPEKAEKVTVYPSKMPKFFRRKSEAIQASDTPRKSAENSRKTLTAKSPETRAPFAFQPNYSS